MLKAIFYSGGQSVVRLLLALVSLKVIAAYLGPGGMAVYGQLQGMIQISSAALSAPVSSGLVKEVAATQSDVAKVATTAFVMLVLLSVLLSIIYIPLIGFVDGHFFDGGLGHLLWFVPLAAFFSALSVFLLSLFNGNKEYNKFFSYSTIMSFGVFGIAIFLCVFYGSKGALYSSFLSPLLAGSIVFIVWCFFNGSSFFKIFKPDFSLVKRLAGFSAYFLVASVSMYLSHIMVRDYLSKVIDLESSGLWYSMTRFSEVYMGVLSIVFTSILIPAYAGDTGGGADKLIKRYKFLALMAGVGIVAIVWMLGSVGIKLVYGVGFEMSSYLLRYYVIGDAIKVVSWVYLLYLISNGSYKLYCATEVFSSVLFFILVVALCGLFGLEYAALGYVLQSLFSLVLLFFIVKFGARDNTLKQ